MPRYFFASVTTACPADVSEVVASPLTELASASALAKAVPSVDDEVGVSWASCAWICWIRAATSVTLTPHLLGRSVRGPACAARPGWRGRRAGRPRGGRAAPRARRHVVRGAGRRRGPAGGRAASAVAPRRRRAGWRRPRPRPATAG